MVAHTIYEYLFSLLIALSSWQPVVGIGENDTQPSFTEGHWRKPLMRKAISVDEDNNQFNGKLESATRLEPSIFRGAKTRAHIGGRAGDIATDTLVMESNSSENRAQPIYDVCTERPASKERPAIYVIVPDVRTPARMAVVLRNIEWLRNQEVAASCEIFVSNKSVTVPDSSQASPCRVRRSRRAWTETLQNLPEKTWAGHDFILLWMDDVIPDPKLDLQWMTEIMSHNRLGIASPSYNPGKSKLRSTETMLFQAGPGKTGRFVNFLEFRFTLMIPTAFRCLKKMIEPSLSSQGWGLESLFHDMCPHHCMGVVDAMTIVDTAEACTHDCKVAQLELEAYEDEHGHPPPRRSLGALASPEFHRRRYHVPKSWLRD